MISDVLLVVNSGRFTVVFLDDRASTSALWVVRSLSFFQRLAATINAMVYKMFNAVDSLVVEFLSESDDDYERNGTQDVQRCG
jgi:hypothetical protein